MNTESTETQEKKLETLEEAVMSVLMESAKDGKCMICNMSAVTSTGHLHTVSDFIMNLKNRDTKPEYIQNVIALLKKHNLNNNDPICVECGRKIFGDAARLVHPEGANSVDKSNPNSSDGKFFDPRSIY